MNLAFEDIQRKYRAIETTVSEIKSKLSELDENNRKKETTAERTKSVKETSSQTTPEEENVKDNLPPPPPHPPSGFVFPNLQVPPPNYQYQTRNYHPRMQQQYQGDRPQRNQRPRHYQARPNQHHAPRHTYRPRNNDSYNPRKHKPYFPRKQTREQRNPKESRAGQQAASGPLHATCGWQQQQSYPWASSWLQLPQQTGSPVQHWGNWPGLGWAPAGFYKGY